jgi:hypothetical protein
MSFVAGRKHRTQIFVLDEIATLAFSDSPACRAPMGQPLHIAAVPVLLAAMCLAAFHDAAQNDGKIRSDRLLGRSKRAAAPSENSVAVFSDCDCMSIVSSTYGLPILVCLRENEAIIT